MAFQQKKSQYAREELVSMSKGMKYKLPKQVFAKNQTYHLPAAEVLNKQRKIPVGLIIFAIVLIEVIVMVILRMTGKISFPFPVVPHL